MKEILVVRFSALGDVTIAYHTISAVLEQNKNVRIILLTKPFFCKIFENLDRVLCYDTDLKNKHKGIFGLRKLAKELNKKYDTDTFIDLHNVLRTKIIRFFLPRRIKKFVIDKGKNEKRQLTRPKNKILQPLKHSAERYADVFRKSGLTVNLKNYSAKYNAKLSPEAQNFINKIKLPKIAVAPFAAHPTKMYPLEKTKKLIKKLSKNYHILILGGGKKEKQTAEQWAKQFPNTSSIIGKFSLSDEIKIIDTCLYTITPDSGNMHLASLTQTKIISIWGATHPYLGFTPFGKKDTIFVQKNLPCRPCSVFGNKKCKYKTNECLNIPVSEITKHIKTNEKQG